MRSFGYYIMLSPLWVYVQVVALCILVGDAVASLRILQVRG